MPTKKKQNRKNPHNSAKQISAIPTKEKANPRFKKPFNKTSAIRDPKPRVDSLATAGKKKKPK